MVRRRERWANLAWLQWMEDDTGEGAIDTAFETPLAVSKAIETLVKTYTRYIDLERDGDAYRVRVMPHSAPYAHGPLAIGMAYVGNDLRNILTTAVIECDMIAGRTMAYRSGSGEKWRWVR